MRLNDKERQTKEAIDGFLVWLVGTPKHKASSTRTRSVDYRVIEAVESLRTGKTEIITILAGEHLTQLVCSFLNDRRGEPRSTSLE